MDRYDSVIIGAGHNGLVCASYLAKAGQKVLVLEASSEAGGLAATSEFFPGFKRSVAHTVSHFCRQIVADLQLQDHGYDLAPDKLRTVGLSPGRVPVIVENNRVSGVSTADAKAYTNYLAQLEKLANALKPFWSKTIPRIGPGSLTDLMTYAHLGLKLRMLGKSDMREFMRLASLPARDLMDENFEDELLKATLSWDGIIGSKMAPRSPNRAVLVMLYRMAELSRDTHNPATRSLINALLMCAQANGVDVSLGTAVRRIHIDGNEDGLTANGVETEDGKIIHADRVVSSADPQTTFVNLVGVEHLDIGFTNRIRRLRCEGLVGKLHLALSGLPDFTGLDQASGRLLLAPNVDAIEYAFDDSKYGSSSNDPVLEVVLPSLNDRSLAPDGQHVLSAHVMYVPHKLKGGWTDDARRRIADRSIDTLETFAPGIRDLILHSEFLTPADLENKYRVSGGHWHHTEIAMDQMLMMRPTYEAAQYATPVSGLYLCGAGCHPGGDLSGNAGHNAAQEILR
ncbi:MAG: NAD(P)/FAD-dependent oxidoreductase [Pseudomonadota bacterium]